jgi:hypothetical protein
LLLNPHLKLTHLHISLLNFILELVNLLNSHQLKGILPVPAAQFRLKLTNLLFFMEELILDLITTLKKTALEESYRLKLTHLVFFFWRTWFLSWSIC